MVCTDGPAGTTCKAEIAGCKTSSVLDFWAVNVHLCAAEPAQAAGRSHSGWRDLGDAAEGHGV